MRVLGIDPGYALVGFGVLDYNNYQNSIVDFGVVSTDKDEEMPDRLYFIYQGIKELIKKYKPDVVAIEELFFFKNITTAIPVAQARGVIIVACRESGIPIYEYTPLQIKQALTGNGRAEKKQVQYMVKVLLNLEKIPKPDDAADAVAVAITHSQISPILNNNKMWG